MADERRRTQLGVWLTAEEAATVQRLADDDRRSVSDWLRILIQDRIELEEAGEPA